MQILPQPLNHDELVRGVMALFQRMDIAAIPELPLGRSARRADVVGLDRKGQIFIVEVKATVADFRQDKKWRDYLDYADHFFFAVSDTFPVDEVPAECGLIMADGYDGDILRLDAFDLCLSAARRRALTLSFARLAANRAVKPSTR